ncbi:uncharacterized protein LOC117335067 [Pecten maximus]|uniref:uncharacterized protein LOC117335067 n=1 Tax=Pecten maximus TaxID=6579 RepID=UPI0014581FDB|nr:uncharacterized protein LOC117335067 [Pecten maximus]
MNNPPGYTNATVLAPTFNRTQVNANQTGVMYQESATQGTQGHTYNYVPNHIYQDGPYQGAQGHGSYQRFGVPVPPQPVYPQYNGLSGGHNTVSLRERETEQNSNNNANKIPGQPISLSTSYSSAPQPSTSQLSNSPQKPKAQQGNKDIKSASNLVTTDKSSNTKGQNSNSGPSMQKGKEIEVADGNLTLELPAAGSTEEKPPDGGSVAWRIVLACTILNACSTTCLTILLFSAESMKDDIGEDETESITTACKEIRLLAAPVVAIAIVRLDYRKVSCIGSIMVIIGFLVSGFLPSDLTGVIGLFLGGVAGLGLACWYLCAIIPILEYFQSRRLIALMLSNVGSFASVIIILVVYVEMFKVGNQMKWMDTLQYMAIPGAVGLAVSYFLRPLQLKMNDKTGQSFVEVMLGVLDLRLFKELTLYLVMLVYFFDQFGRGIPNSYITVMMTDKEFTILGDTHTALPGPCWHDDRLHIHYLLEAKRTYRSSLIMGTCGPVCRLYDVTASCFRQIWMGRRLLYHIWNHPSNRFITT